MSEIIPRWEWRSFGLHFGDAEMRLEAHGAGKLQRSCEIYLLSLLSDANVKIRDGLMDIKQLEQTDTKGFEQWRPVLKEAFPLSVAAIEAVFAALGIVSPQELNAVDSSYAKPSPAGEGWVRGNQNKEKSLIKSPHPILLPEGEGVRELMFTVLSPEHVPMTLDQLLAEVTSDSNLRKLEVHKARTRYQLEGCMAELTEVAANGKTIRTIAVESEDPLHISAALQALGLEGLENVSYPRGLKRLLEMGG